MGLTLRPFQRQALEQVMRGRDLLVSAPTGAGKTAIFQAASLALADRGPTVVLSPLRALLVDQQRRAEAMGLASSMISGDVRGAERREALERIESGESSLVMTTPESLECNRRLRMAILGAGGAALFVVDEAHAYEQWAYSFRSAYRRLGRHAAALAGQGVAQFLLVSATITPHGALEAARALNRWDWEVLAQSPVRPNLRFEPWPTAHTANDLLAMMRAPGSGIAYTVYAKRAVELARSVAKVSGISEPGYDEGNRWTGPLPSYTGSMTDLRRQVAQDDWMAASPPWVVATKAFGMGIDRSDVRTVVHVQLPQSLIDYAQEAGRAGRDGEPAVCYLTLAERGEAAEFLIGCEYPPVAAIRRVWDALVASCSTEDWSELVRRELEQVTYLEPAVIGAALGWLRGQQQLVTKQKDRNYRIAFLPGWRGKLTGKRSERRLAMLEVIERDVKPVSGVYMVTGEDLETLLGEVLASWRGALKSLDERGVVRVTRPDDRTWVRLATTEWRFDVEEFERCRQLAFDRLQEVVEFAELPAEERAGVLARAVELNEGKLKALIAESAPAPVEVPAEEEARARRRAPLHRCKDCAGRGEAGAGYRWWRPAAGEWRCASCFPPAPGEVLEGMSLGAGLRDAERRTIAPAAPRPLAEPAALVERAPAAPWRQPGAEPVRGAQVDALRERCREIERAPAATPRPSPLLEREQLDRPAEEWAAERRPLAAASGRAVRERYARIGASIDSARRRADPLEGTLFEDEQRDLEVAPMPSQASYRESLEGRWFLDELEVFYGSSPMVRGLVAIITGVHREKRRRSA